MRWFALLTMAGIVSAAAAVLGIDYGTEFVKSSLVAPNAPFEIVLTPDSQRKDASGLVIKPTDGERFYGSAGLSLLSKYPESSLYAIKGLLGVPYKDLRVALFQEMHPGIELVPTDRQTVGFNISGTVISVEEAVAMQLIDAKARATAMVRDKTHSKTATLNDVAVSVPGKFGSAQRQALIDALSLADANLIGLTSDGAAVAVNYANSPSVSSKLTTDKHYVVVYDVGASAASSTLVGISLNPNDETTVDVVVEGFSSTIELSGQALTTLLREMLFKKFENSHKEVKRTARLLNRLWREAERAKQVLSANTEVHIYIESLADDVDLNTKITREEFEKEADYQVGKVVEPLRASLSGFKGEIDAVVLVGGATRTPFVLEQLKAEVGEAKLSKNVNADEANVQGTCMRGVNLSGIYRSKRIFDVSDIVSHDYTLRIKSASGEDVKDLFLIGSALSSKVDIELPHDVSLIEVYEDRKKLVEWSLPYLKQNLASLREPGAYTCIDKSRLQATFVIDGNGVLKLTGVEASCASKKTPSTSSSTLDSAKPTDSETGNEAAAGETAAAGTATNDKEASTATKTGETNESSDSQTSSKTSTAVEAPRPKTRRVSVQVSWEQAPIGNAERNQIRSHLDAMNKNDEDRKHYSVLHHELESLVYRIRDLVSEGKHELASTVERLSSWIENSFGNLEELKTNLEEAREVFKRETSNPEPEKDASSTSEPSSAAEEQKEIKHDEL